ncbi:Pr6Pr family membrane protein [Microbacterium pseudoresistens]|nr:Pr6Pr family membrane protein [Microbacterium pseudoresistens]
MRAWYLVVIAVVLAGFVLQFYLLFTGGADANSGESGSDIPLGVRFVRLFSFFTVASNLLVMIASASLVVRRPPQGLLWRALRLSTLLSIAVTGTIFSLILAPDIELRGEAVIATTLFHNISPALFVIGWLLWGPRRQWMVRAALLAFIWPLAWLAYTFTRGAITGWYPYPFLDVGQHGIGAVLLSSLAVLAYAVLLTAAVLVVDRFVPAIGTSDALLPGPSGDA